MWIKRPIYPGVGEAEVLENQLEVCHGPAPAQHQPSTSPAPAQHQPSPYLERPLSRGNTKPWPCLDITMAVSMSA